MVGYARRDGLGWNEVGNASLLHTLYDSNLIVKSRISSINFTKIALHLPISKDVMRANGLLKVNEMPVWNRIVNAF